MERPPSAWCNANTVGRPLIRFLKERRNNGENFGEWILTLRALNRSWYIEMTSHIQKTLSLAKITETEFGSLIPMTSVKNLSIKQTSLAIVEKCPNLENLIMRGYNMKKTEFSCNPRLHSLSIHCPDALKIDNPYLYHLEFSWSLELDESFLNGLASLTELTQLRISRYLRRAVSPSRMDALQNLHCAVSRRYSNDEIKHGFLNALPPSLRELEVWSLLSWDDNQLLMEKTTSLNLLEKLTLGNGEGRVGYDDLEWLTKLPNLVELFLWGREVMGRGIVWLTEIPKLRRLALNVENINPEAFQQLCWVGDSVQKIIICCRFVDLETDPVVLETKQLLEERGVEVKLI
ncbi:hypothetical protein BSKO_12632 [Bryopsis sp. KO-2023]|nr:hypothetical protein BSKO_12632 [Bryopsis sp. KO-2023]